MPTAANAGGHECRAYDAEMQVNDGERSVIATINTDIVDRYRTVILPSGGQLDNYRKNPVVLLNHYGSIVGKNQWIVNRGGKLVAKTVFMGRELSEEADQVFRMYQEGYMRGFSISFAPDPDASSKPTKEELAARPDWDGARTIFRKWELIEYSAVTVPANPDALAEAVSRGWFRPEWAPQTNPDVPPDNKNRRIALVLEGLPPLVGRSMDDVERTLLATIDDLAARKGSQAIRDAIDLARGRI